MTHYISCRAKLNDQCWNWKPTEYQFGEDLPQSEDGTFEPLMGCGPNPEPIGDSGDGTIVCDPCYSTLMAWTPSGRGLNHELAEAVSRYKKEHS